MIMSTKEICKRGLSMTISLTLGNTACPAGDGSCPYAGQNCPNRNCPAGGFADLDGDWVCDYSSAARHCGQGGGHHGGHWN